MTATKTRKMSPRERQDQLNRIGQVLWRMEQIWALHPSFTLTEVVLLIIRGEDGLDNMTIRARLDRMLDRSPVGEGVEL